MFFRNALASFLHLFGVFSFVGGGVVSLCLYLSPISRFKVIEGLFAHPEIALIIALIFWGIAIVMTLGFYGLHRGRYLRLKMGKYKTDVDVSLVRGAVEQCLRAHFKEAIFLGVAVRGGNQLEIELQSEKLEPQKLAELNLLLQGKLGLNPFYLTLRSTSKASFDRES